MRVINHGNEALALLDYWIDYSGAAMHMHCVNILAGETRGVFLSIIISVHSYRGIHE